MGQSAMTPAEALEILGLDNPLPLFAAASTVGEAQARFESWKDTDLREAHRRLALGLHPDRTGRDTTAEMAQVNAARDLLRGMEIAVRPSRPVPPPAWWGGGLGFATGFGGLGSVRVTIIR